MAIVDRRTPCSTSWCSKVLGHEGQCSPGWDRLTQIPEPRKPTPLWAKIVGTAVATPAIGIIVGGLWYTCLWIWKAVLGL